MTIIGFIGGVFIGLIFWSFVAGIIAIFTR